ncbi:peptidylprolyl isomerase [Candidatus Microgenomates bacterium]|nr:MAG: peptidylprolyl isomerase [Candidatus Microgenomates bacterium]
MDAARRAPTIVPTVFATPTSSIADSSQQASTSATIKTSKGDIVLTLYGKDAPQTVENFVNKAKNGFYSNLTFHRVEDWVIQGGDPKGDGTGGGNMPVEFNSKPFLIGSLGVASRGDGKVQNDSQFFITKKDAAWLNGQYTNFGFVTKGMDIVEKIEIGDKILGISLE